MSSPQSNELGQIYVKLDIKTQILRYVSARSVARNSNCQNNTLCIGDLITLLNASALGFLLQLPMLLNENKDCGPLTLQL